MEAESDDRRESSNVTTALVVAYVRAHGGDEAVARLLAEAGERRPVAELEDARRWGTQDEKIRLFKAAVKVLGDPDAPRRIGQRALEASTTAGLQLLLRTLGSPGGLLRSVAKASAKFSTNYTCTALSIGRQDAVVSNRLHDGYTPEIVDCLYTMGLLSTIPALFGLGLATIDHDECQAHGATECIYRLRWRPRHRLPWRAAAAREASLSSRLELIETRHEALRSSLVDLVSPADVDTVLARITRRAADAVQAQRFLLALHGGGVHHEGMSEEEAVELAAQVLDSKVRDGSAVQQSGFHGSLLIVDVESSRRAYGRLAAVYEGLSNTFFPEERPLLTTYAQQAAVALDAATALEDARDRGTTAQALLALARALAEATTSDEVAHRLAAAVPEVIGGHRSSVLLWDEERRCLSRPKGEELLRLRETDSPEISRLVEARTPIRYHRTHADPFIRQLLAEASADEVLVVPIASGDAFFGVITTTRDVGSEPFADRRVLSDRLAGLADHAALAFQKVRLLEHERAAVRRLRQEEQRIKHLAYHDQLTGLANGRLFGEALDTALVRARAGGGRLAVLFCDLDRFKNVNDSLGHARGDELLGLAARRLYSCVSSERVLARLGGDEFAVLMSGVGDAEEASALAERMLRVLADPFAVAGQELFVTASIGVAVFPDDGADGQQLLMNADAAMYGAKRSGANAHLRYRPSLNAGSRGRLALEAELHGAIARDELVLHYQPQVSPVTGAVEVVEALVRWQHPERGLLLPADFIPLAEDCGLITAVDEWVVRRACADAAHWAPARVAVNQSASQFHRPALVAIVAEALAAAGAPGSSLELELTETVMRRPEDVAVALTGLRDLGVSLALDDFGTGYSVWGHLKRFPIDRIKIDRSFVAGLPEDCYDRATVSALIRMAHEVGMKVTAEGVETVEQSKFLASEGCDLLQGYLFARPGPVDETRVAEPTAAG